MSWDAEKFYEKSKLYIRQATRIAPEDRFYVFWHLTAFEHLVRACFAKSANAVLAEPNSAKNVLFSYGILADSIPRQRTIGELIEVIHWVVPSFNEDLRKLAKYWTGLRNEELHSDTDKLSDLAETSWQGDYYLASSVLVTHLSKTLADYFGKEDAKSISELLASRREEVAKETKKEIARCQTFFSKLSQVEVKRIESDLKRPPRTKPVLCPACKHRTAFLFGEVLSVGEVTYEDDELFQMVKFLPNELRCELCRLELQGFYSIDSVGLGAQFSIRQQIDPIEQFNIDIKDEYESRYGQQYEDEYMDE